MSNNHESLSVVQTRSGVVAPKSQVREAIGDSQKSSEVNLLPVVFKAIESSRTTMSSV